MLDKEQIENWEEGYPAPLSTHYLNTLVAGLSLFVDKTELTYTETVAINRSMQIINQHKVK